MFTFPVDLINIAKFEEALLEGHGYGGWISISCICWAKLCLRKQTNIPSLIYAPTRGFNLVLNSVYNFALHSFVISEHDSRCLALLSQGE